MRIFGVCLRPAAAAAALLFPGTVFSQDFTIDDGQAFIGNLIMADPNDIGTIISNGSVTASIDGADAIYMAKDNQRFEIQSAGFLQQEANQAAAVLSAGRNAGIENFGSVLTSGDGAHGVVSLGENAIINNRGLIATRGLAAAGIIIAGADGRSRNTGSIQAAGDGASGVIVDGADGQLENAGVIKTSGLASSGLIAGDDADGATLTNSGAIISPLDGASQAIGISSDAEGVTLNLRSGSVIQGAINFAGTNGTVAIANGMNTALQFNLANTVDLQTFGSPYVATAGNLLAVVDPTGFSAHDEMLADATRQAANAVEDRLALSRMARGAANDIWLDSTSGYRHAKPNNAAVGFDNLFGGLMVGIDRPLQNFTRAGFFAGLGAGQMETDTGSQAITMQNYFTGSYARLMSDGVFFDLGILAGIANFDSDRRIANNLVAGGMEHAEASYQGVYASPSLAVGTDIAAGGSVLTPSIGVRYTGLFVESYAEKGSAADLHVEGRRIDVFEVCGQLAASMAPYDIFAGEMTHVLRFGAEGYFSDGEQVDAVLLGQATRFEAAKRAFGARGFAGFETRYQSDDGWQFGSTVDFGIDAAGSLTATAGLVLDLSF